MATDPLSQIDPQYLVPMKGGKMHPTYPGVLAAAMANGLREMTVKLLQAPTEENGWLAISEATAVFTAADGRDRVFTEIGDADGHNTGPHIAPHRVRMSATRAKGRALRDALGLGVALAEEMGPDNAETTSRDRAPVDQSRVQGGARREVAAREQSRARGSSAPMGAAAGDRGAAAGPVVAGSAADPAVTQHWCSECGQEIKPTVKRPASEVVRLSMEMFGAALCVHCVQEKQTLATANLPAGRIAA